ncbi:MAG TPA: ankyrin repeat domain-containing protein [Planctomycetia bacterium]|nr:ankyrin repeat domain-containing protein [Planctomycetia bacterium]
MSNRRKPDRAAPPSVDELRAALGAGDPKSVAALLNAGADIRYRRPHDYDALIDAVFNRRISDDPRLLELLELLIARGAPLSGVTSYRESALRHLSRCGRFDAVKLLLDAGADRDHLQWSPLHEAVALGTVADLEAALESDVALEARDYWSRTPFHLALVASDVPKAQLLQDLGADVGALGHFGASPVFLALKSRNAAMLRWLLESGADPFRTDEAGATALMEAVEDDFLEAVDILLAFGSDLAADCNGTALTRARSRAVALRLLEAGADPVDLVQDVQRAILGFGEIDEAPLAKVPPKEYSRSFAPAFGASNPEMMDRPLWEAMIRSGVTAYAARRYFEKSCGELPAPGWCAHRFGQSLTMLPDGRAIQIGGEHEDFYDPDFFIYNDVIVHPPDGAITIFGYPESVFPPTDFHTATLVGDFIYVIGRLGYCSARHPGRTPVYRLDLSTMKFACLTTTGDPPGWIFKHRADFVAPNSLRIRGGSILPTSDADPAENRNHAAFILELDSFVWRRES